jgi:hypothetical protein
MSDDDPIKLRDFLGWRCDSCGHMIATIVDGWVEWLATESDYGNETLSGLRLVHRESVHQNGRDHSCRYDPRNEFRNNRTIVEGLPLERFVGPDGLMLLLSLLLAGELPQAEILELVKRIQIPGYELARNLPQKRNGSNLLIPVLGHECYLQSEIREMIEWTLRKESKSRWRVRNTNVR